MSILSRWTARLRGRQRLLTRARRAHEAHPTPASRALLERRKRQVTFAQRVVTRHRGPYVIGWQSLRHVAPWLSETEAKQHAAALGPAFRKYAIVTPRRAAAAVAQFAHESAGFHTTTEYATGAEYEGRRDLGNTHPGDGKRFKGRGYIQITGRGNYSACTSAFGHDFISRPADLATPRWAALASCWWWSAHGCNQLADSGDFVALTRRINGLTSREEYHHRAQQVAHGLVPRQEN
jgi:putative chitinase